MFGMQTVLQTLIATVDQDSAANYSLLLMWASLANAIPVCIQVNLASYPQWDGKCAVAQLLGHGLKA